MFTTGRVLKLARGLNKPLSNGSRATTSIRCFATTTNKDGISNVKLDRNEKDGKNYIDMHNKVIMNTYARVPDIVITHGKDSYLYDMKGDKYLDFGSGIAVNALGHSNNEWVQVVTEQANKVTHLSNLYFNQPAIELAQSLIGKTACFDKVFFSNSGTEANEAALKFAKKIAIEKCPTKYEIIAFTQGFSGRSMGALSCTYKPKYREIYGPLVPGVHFATYNDLESVKKLMDPKKTAAVIIEPIQGEGGLESATMEFISGLGKLCKENDVILIADEVQCGLGRTGRLFAHERFIDTCKPDIMTLAKPLAGGLPIGATLVTDKVAQAIHPGDHGTTFGGGPLACQVANFVFSKISSPAFLKDVQDKGEYMVAKLKSLESGKKYIKDIRTVGGLFVGLEIDRNVNDLVKFAKDNKVLFISAGENTIRLCPPLTITKPEIDIAINVIDKYFKSL
ncbi:hypothetical protein CYY_002452 [Polysphondylium violaceum]|uniref:acetylornithine transaminase n=1 Tax=Polysphondylium violaceum TaxID=133409 RepID=A0A8J4Q7V0_9MYCE|nr:hypothetical protein CYY_002452 [Polysphondylium violaceum]